MRIFLCAGEPSGDLHGANLIQEFRRLHPQVDCVGFGGERMEAAGCRLLYPLCRLAVMWFLRVLLNLHVFFDLLARADRLLRSAPARRGHPDRLSRIQLAPGPACARPRHPGVLLRPAATMGLGRLACEQDAPLGRSRPLHTALREGVVPNPPGEGPLRRPSLLRRARRNSASMRLSSPSSKRDLARSSPSCPARVIRKSNATWRR